MTLGSVQEQRARGRLPRPSRRRLARLEPGTNRTAAHDQQRRPLGFALSAAAQGGLGAAKRRSTFANGPNYLFPGF
jgi:hypothetical protein